MIYIIDDKPERRKENAPYLEEKINRDKIVIIENRKILDHMKSKLFSKKNIICFHDSFFKNPANKHLKKSFDVIKRDFVDKCQKDGIILVLFSGDFSGINFLNDSTLSINVGKFYNNLKQFVENEESERNPLKTIAFGPNWVYEEVFILRHKLFEALAPFDVKQIADYNIINDYVEPMYRSILDENYDDEIDKLKDLVDAEILTMDLLLTIINENVNTYLYEKSLYI